MFTVARSRVAEATRTETTSIPPAGNITVVRDVSARNAAPLPVKSITVVRDVSARDTVVRPVAPIRVVRDTPARDAARAARAGAKAIAYFKTMERPTFRQTSGDAAIR